MESIKIKKYKGKFEIDLFRDIHVQISFDENIEQLIEEGNGVGEKYIMSHVRVRDLRNDVEFENLYFFPLDIRIENVKDLFINEIGLILKHWRKSQIIDWISPSNPECAWLYYKKTFDKVLNGPEIWKMGKCSTEIICECSDGKEVVFTHLEDDTERLFLDGEYLGRVDTIIDEKPGIMYCKCDMSEGNMPFFILNTEESEKYPGGDYKKAFSFNDNIFLETGIHIYHTGNLAGIVEGLLPAADEYIRRNISNVRK